jgi:hypothetical protein
MIKIEKTEIFGWEAAIRGMRNSFNSWEKSDSHYDTLTGKYIVGPADIDLMDRLSRSGPSHAKFLRYITVQFDITAPRYWWAEMDTYKVGTVRNSCSTMHKVQAKEFVREDFSCEHLNEESLKALDILISTINSARDRFNETKKQGRLVADDSAFTGILEPKGDSPVELSSFTGNLRNPQKSQA